MTNDQTQILIASGLFLPDRVEHTAAVVVAADGTIQSVWRDVDTRMATG